MYLHFQLAGANHYIVTSERNHVYAFGLNEYGQCGNDLLGVRYTWKSLAKHDYGKKTSELIEDRPWKLVTYDVNDFWENDDNWEIEKVACGDNHTVLLTKDNRIFTFGYNRWNQCSTIKKDDTIGLPLWFSKELELGVSEDSVVTDIIALNNGTLIAIEDN